MVKIPGDDTYGMPLACVPEMVTPVAHDNVFDVLYKYPLTPVVGRMYVTTGVPLYVKLHLPVAFEIAKFGVARLVATN